MLQVDRRNLLALAFSMAAFSQAGSASADFQAPQQGLRDYFNRTEELVAQLKDILGERPGEGEPQAKFEAFKKNSSA